MSRLNITKKRCRNLSCFTNRQGIFNALALDQRGVLKRMMGQAATEQRIVEFKKLISKELTPWASSILLDPEYGLAAAQERTDAGLLMAYEKTGYDANIPGRIPDLLPHWSVKKLKVLGADAIKILLYYDPDEKQTVNDLKCAFVQRVGEECYAENIPFFLELLSYNANKLAPKNFIKLKPRKVITMMKEFSKPCYGADVLKVETPVSLNYVAGFGQEIFYTKEEARSYFKAQSEVTPLPFIFLSGGMPMNQFLQTLEFAKSAGSQMSGVLCGRATWQNALPIFIKEGEEKCSHWLRTEGATNLKKLQKVLVETAVSYKLRG